jgi:hypothetical protein
MPAPPPDQSLRQIGFLLTGAPAGDFQFVFGLRPEDLTVHEPSRLTVQQTLGGAWADSFDIGITTITLAGHCGWRGGTYLSGEELFQGLRDTVFQAWHDGRADAIQQGQDPDTVSLYFTDSLDGISVIVAPRSFQLRRSKSSPLLMRYQINLLVLDQADGPDFEDDAIVAALSNPMRWLAAADGLTNAALLILRYETLALGAFGSAAAAIRNFVGIGVAIINSVADTARAVIGQFTALEGAILSVGVQLCQAASNAFTVLAADITLTAEEILPMMALASAFNDAFCSMRNAFDLIGVFPDYAAMRGASSCSSTGGGDPASIFALQDVSPFGYVFPSGAPMVSVTADAQAAMDSLQGDPLAYADQQSIVADLMRRTGQGISVP